MGSRVLLARVCALALALATFAAAAAEPAQASPAVSPAARAVLDNMTKYLAGLQRFSIKAEESRDAVVMHGYKLQQQQQSTMWVERPNRLRVEVSGDIKQRTYVYDGKTVTVHAPESRVYAQIAAKPTIKETIESLLADGVEMPLIDVLTQAFAGTLTEHVMIGRVVGESRIDGVPVDHLAFRQASIDWQLWVEKGDRPLPRKLVITTRYEVSLPQYEATLEWDLAPTVAKGAFEFVPPDGHHEIDLVVEGGAP